MGEALKVQLLRKMVPARGAPQKQTFWVGQ